MYDLSKEYEEKVLPLVQEVQKACYKLNMPFFMTFAVADNEKHTKYASEIYDDAAAGIELKNSYINQMACVLNGFVLVPSTDFLPMDEDTVFKPVQNFDDDDISDEEFEELQQQAAADRFNEVSINFKDGEIVLNSKDSNEGE